MLVRETAHNSQTDEQTCQREFHSSGSLKFGSRYWTNRRLSTTSPGLRPWSKSSSSGNSTAKLPPHIEQITAAYSRILGSPSPLSPRQICRPFPFAISAVPLVCTPTLQC